MESSKVVKDLSKEITDKEKELLAEIIEIMSKGATNIDDLVDSDAMTVLNKCGISLDVLKRVAFKSLVSQGADKELTAMYITTLVQLATITGGVSFYDYHVTETMAKDMGKENE